MCCQQHQQRILAEADWRGIIYDAQQNMLGYVSDNGFLYDCNCTLLGYVNQFGAVRDINLRLVSNVNLKDHFPFESGKEAFFLLFRKEK
jgi:hypothetical protein